MPTGNERRGRPTFGCSQHERALPGCAAVRDASDYELYSCSVELHLFVDFRQGEFYADGREIDRLVQAAGNGRCPDPVGPFCKEFQPRAVLRNQEILLKRRQLTVVIELFAAVVGFGRLGEDFGEQCRIKGSVEIFAV